MVSVPSVVCSVAIWRLVEMVNSVPGPVRGPSLKNGFRQKELTGWSRKAAGEYAEPRHSLNEKTATPAKPKEAVF